MNPNSDQKRIAFGYKRDGYNKITVRKCQAATVQLIFMCYEQGDGFGTIKATLESHSIPSPRGGKKWGRQTISNILSNPHYIGNAIYPRIVTKELFDKVQEIKRCK